MRGINPRTSRMLSERSTIWATSPLRKRGAIALSNLPSVIEIVEQSPLLHIVVILALSVRVINQCVSHANRLPSRLTCPAGGVQKSCVCQTDVYDSLISIVMFPPTSFWGKPWWFGTPIAFSTSSVLFQMLHFAYWTYKSMSSFGFQNSLPYFLFWFSGSFEKLEMRGASIPVPLALKASALPSEPHP